MHFHLRKQQRNKCESIRTFERDTSFVFSRFYLRRAAVFEFEIALEQQVPFPFVRAAQHRFVEIELAVRFQQSLQVVVFRFLQPDRRFCLAFILMLFTHDYVVALDPRYYPVQTFVVLSLFQTVIDAVYELVDGFNLQFK